MYSHEEKLECLKGMLTLIHFSDLPWNEKQCIFCGCLAIDNGDTVPQVFLETMIEIGRRKMTGEPFISDTERDKLLQSASTIKGVDVRREVPEHSRLYLFSFLEPVFASCVTAMFSETEKSWTEIVDILKRFAPDKIARLSSAISVVEHTKNQEGLYKCANCQLDSDIKTSLFGSQTHCVPDWLRKIGTVLWKTALCEDTLESMLGDSLAFGTIFPDALYEVHERQRCTRLWMSIQLAMIGVFETICFILAKEKKCLAVRVLSDFLDATCLRGDRLTTLLDVIRLSVYIRKVPWPASNYTRQKRHLMNEEDADVDTEWVWNEELFLPEGQYAIRYYLDEVKRPRHGMPDGNDIFQNQEMGNTLESFWVWLANVLNSTTCRNYSDASTAWKWRIFLYIDWIPCSDPKLKRDIIGMLNTCH